MKQSDITTAWHLNSDRLDIMKKLEQLRDLKFDHIHVGVCTDDECADGFSMIFDEHIDRVAIKDQIIRLLELKLARIEAELRDIGVEV